MGAEARIAELQARIAELEAELQPHRDAKQRATEARARLQAIIDSAPPEPEMTPEEEAEVAKSFEEMFRACESCGLARMSSVEDESCHCCHGCNRLRLVLRDVLRYYEHVDDPIIDRAWAEFHGSDPAGAQITQIAYDLKRRNGLFTKHVEHNEPVGPFRHAQGWRLVVAIRGDDLPGGVGVFDDYVAVSRPDPEKPLLMRVTMPRGDVVKESDSWYEVYTTIVDYYRSHGLIPAEDIWPT